MEKTITKAYKLDKNMANEVIHFLVGFGGFNWEKAEQFTELQPGHAQTLAQKIHQALLADKTLTDDLKEEVKKFKIY